MTEMEIIELEARRVYLERLLARRQAVAAADPEARLPTPVTRPAAGAGSGAPR
jgi:hypothetical protein